MDLASSHPDNGHPAAHPENRPLLAIDVDGVISLFGFETAPAPEVARFELIDGTPHCISIAAAERIRRLSEHFELVWATGWQDRANDRLSLITGIGPLPVIEFDAHRKAGSAAETTAAHWKLSAIDSFCGDRPLAWIDDSFDESCYSWAETRENRGAPTLLVPTDPEIGFEEAQASATADWAKSLNAPDVTVEPGSEARDHLH